MKAMVLREVRSLQQRNLPLSFMDVSKPEPGQGEVLIRVTRCGVCHTELDEIEGRTPPAQLPMILGHQVVGIVEGVQSPPAGELPHSYLARERLDSVRVGVAWIASACGRCQFCLSGRENL